MKKRYQKLGYVLKNVTCLLVSVSMLVQPLFAEERAGDHAEEGSALVLNEASQSAAGIRVETVSRRPLDEMLSVPGEIKVNAYRSERVTPRIPAQIVARHARLGDSVTVGQRLVTLSSIEMAEAQGQLIVTYLEWKRVQALGREAVSARRYAEAEVAHQQALATVRAYGMTESQAMELMRASDPAKASGDFDLVASIAGTILNDAFIVGDFIERGSVLFDISDEAIVWVEAQAMANTLHDVPIGSTARVSLDGEHWSEGRVIQRHHRMSEATRTSAIRIELKNEDDRFHPAQFVQVEIPTGKTEPVLAVPTAAITQMDGAPTVFKLEPGNEFHAQALVLGRSVADWTIVRAGLEVGDQVAVAGVFYLKSLKLKSTLGEGHGH